MCLAVPAKLISIDETNDMFRTGIADFSGVRREINLAYVPEAAVGDYVLVHVGFAINLMDEAEALKTLEELREIAAELDAGDDEIHS